MTSKKQAKEIAEELGVKVSIIHSDRTFAAAEYTNCFARITVHRGQWLVIPEDGKDFYAVSKMEHGKFKNLYMKTGRGPYAEMDSEDED